MTTTATNLDCLVAAVDFTRPQLHLQLDALFSRTVLRSESPVQCMLDSEKEAKTFARLSLHRDGQLFKRCNREGYFLKISLRRHSQQTHVKGGFILLERDSNKYPVLQGLVEATGNEVEFDSQGVAWLSCHLRASTFNANIGPLLEFGFDLHRHGVDSPLLSVWSPPFSSCTKGANNRRELNKLLAQEKRLAQTPSRV